MSKADQRHGANRADRYDSENFGDLVYQQLRNAPWVLCSVGVHAVLGLLLFVYPWEQGQTEQPATMIAMAAPEDVDQLDEDEPPEIPDVEVVEETDKVVEETHLEDAKIDDHDETDDDADTDETFGDPDNPSTHDLDWHSTNATIGIGGNAGGKFGRGGGGNENLRAVGNGRKTENAIDLALEWLKNHQASDGRWKCDGFSEECKLNKCDGPGEAAYTPGVSGLSLLAFLGAGETHQSGAYQTTVRKGLKYLKSIQDSEGCFGPRTSQHFQYNHACASLAMTEAYGMTGSRLFKDAAQRGVNFVHQSQNPYLAWRYGVRDGDNDTSVTGWMTMALKSAKMADLEVDSTAFKGAVAWVDKMTEPEFGRVGYQQRGGQPARTTEMMDRFPADQSESLTAVGVLTRIFAGQDPATTPAIQQGAELMSKKLPKWDVDAGSIDMYYWYYGTLAMFQVGGKHWKAWNARLKTDMVDNQRLEQNRDERGSWDPVGPWAPEGGRVYSTAVMAMCMEVYHRYGKVFGTR